MHSYIVFIHVLTVILWFAGMLFLPRIFLIQQQANHAQLNSFARGIYYKLILPASMIATTLGLYLAVILKFQGGWIHTKLTLVIILWVYQLYSKKIMSTFAQDKNTKSQKFLKIFSIIPVVIFSIMVGLAIIKPF